jgi:Ca-activated chloride channel family protein
VNKLKLIASIILLAWTAGCDEAATDEQKKDSTYIGNKTAQEDAGMSAGTPSAGPATGEKYEKIEDNIFQDATVTPMSTFSVDVDTASYSNVRSKIQSGMQPNPWSVRIEEMINYFSYAYPQPTDQHPFSMTLESGSAPWKADNRLLKIGLKGKEVAVENRPPANLVFLIDVSGSMRDDLELVKSGLKILAENMQPTDKTAIVVYAGAAGLVLEPTSDKNLLVTALDSLASGGSTAGGEGIKLAYAVADSAKIPGGINRVVMATDGDFNVGLSSDEELVTLVTEQAKLGIELSVLGFGHGNLNDSMMEKISNQGNGNYYYIDTMREAEKVLGRQLNGTLVTIAKDVKVQVEFNKETVKSYRLIGYENRVMNNDDFNDDKKDAGEIGAGHTVTALYEIVPADGVDITGLKVADIRLRYKLPEGTESILMTSAATDNGKTADEQSGDFKFCTAVAGFGMLLRNSDFRGLTTHDLILALAEAGKGADLTGDRAEFIDLVQKHKTLPAVSPEAE